MAELKTCLKCGFQVNNNRYCPQCGYDQLTEFKKTLEETKPIMIDMLEGNLIMKGQSASQIKKSIEVFKEEINQIVPDVCTLEEVKVNLKLLQEKYPELKRIS